MGNHIYTNTTHTAMESASRRQRDSDDEESRIDPAIGGGSKRQRISIDDSSSDLSDAVLELEDEDDIPYTHSVPSVRSRSATPSEVRLESPHVIHSQTPAEQGPSAVPDAIEVIEVMDATQRPAFQPSESDSNDEPKPEIKPLKSYVCPICFDPPTDMVLTPCGHSYCMTCALKALATTKADSRGRSSHHTGACALCRSPVTFKTLILVKMKTRHTM